MINFYASFSRVNASHAFFSIFLVVVVVATVSAVCRRHFKLAPICHLTLAKLGPQNVFLHSCSCDSGKFLGPGKKIKESERKGLSKIGKEFANV